MSDTTVEIRIVGTDELSPVFAQAARNTEAFFGTIRNAGDLSARESLRAWRGMLREIDSAEDAFVRDLLWRRQSLSQSLMDMAARLVESEIANDLKYFTNYAILSALGIDTDRVAAQQGLLAHLLTEAAKTEATTAGVAARGAAEAAGQATGLMGLLSNALKAIGIDAAETFGGIFAFLSPIMGPAAAGPAAAGAATVEGAIGTIASFDVGAWEIPRDITGLMTLHAGETIMPASFASGFRAAVSGAGEVAAPATANITFAPQISALDGKSVVALLNDPSIMRQLARNLQSYLAANPSVRGAY